jgi:tRNA-dihydrouridine synthase
MRGRPWTCAAIAAALGYGPAVTPPTGSRFLDLVRSHYDALLEFYGTAMAARVARKHLGWYMDVVGTPPPLRRRVLTSEPEGIWRLLPEALCSQGAQAA